MIVGTFGKTVFEVSAKQAKTIQSMTWTSKAKYAKHELNQQPSRLEYTGTEPDEIELEIKLSKAFGVNPLDDIVELLRVEREGIPNNLVVGEKIYGKDRWVIESSERGMEVFDGRGNMIEVTYKLKLLAYEERRV